MKIKRFEHIVAGPTTSLLRVSGRPPWRRGAAQRPTLVLDKDGDAHRYAALPAPDDPRGTLRAAYSVPSALIASDSKYWLEHADGSLNELPQPTPGASRGEEDARADRPTNAEGRGAREAVSAATGPEPPPPDVEHDRRSDIHSKLAEQSSELALSERAAAESDQARRLSEAELARAREAIENLERRVAELDAEREQDRLQIGDALAAGAAATQQRVAEGEANAQQRVAETEANAQQRVADAEARAAAAEEQARSAVQQPLLDAEARAAEAAARATAAEERVQALTTDAASTQESLKEVQQHNGELEQTVLEQAERIESLDALVAGSQPEQSALERELAVVRSSRASLESELDQARDQLRVMTFERDELSRQAAAFDGVAVKARDRATKAESQNEQMSATLRELETWRAELERRLAATTSELGVAKAAREADERELKRMHDALAAAESGPGSAPSSEASETLSAQSAEIELLATEVASLRAERDAAIAGGQERTGEDTGRIAQLEAERAEIARRADQLSAALEEALRPAQVLAELARSGLEESHDTGTDTHIELISQSAERTAHDQAERELREASREFSRGGNASS
jgi:hypothetical protein